jgi:hypothetical protein
VIEVSNILVRSFVLDYLDIFWEVQPTYEDLLDYEFFVEKSNAQFGPFMDLVGPFRNVFHVRDNTVRGQRGFYNYSFYRIRVRHLASGDEATYPSSGSGVRMDAAPDLHALEMARIENLRLKEHTGRSVWVFPRKRTGQRCSCYDRVTKRMLVAACQTCFGTGWVGGYDTPLKVWAQIVSPEETTIRDEMGEHGIENTMCKFANFPELQEGWVVVEAENIRWRVGSSLTKIRKGRALVRQQIPVHRISPSDIEYSIPVNVGDISTLVPTPPRNMTNPQTLSGARSTTDAIEFYSEG